MKCLILIHLEIPYGFAQCQAPNRCSVDAVVFFGEAEKDGLKAGSG